jgi:site-specific DNA recombinase
MKDQTTRRSLRGAIYTRVSTDQGLEQDFNSLDAQREACEAYIKSQAHEGWRLVRDRYNDGGFSGGSMDRPALQKLLIDVQARRIDVIVVYKVDRLTRSLADFAKLVETFDAHGVSFVSVTQSFNTTTSMGRLTLNVLLSFAQFEREVTGERIRDKIAASKKKGIWMGGVVPLGYRVEDRALHVVEDHAEIVRSLFRRYLEAGSVVRLKQQLDAEGFRIPIRIDGGGRSTGGGLFNRGMFISSCRTRSMSAGSPIRARCTKANTRRSCPKSCGSKSSEACAIISALRGLRERANHSMRYSQVSSMTTAATG